MSADQTGANGAVSQVRVHFSEAMLDAGPSGAHSVTNATSYAITGAGADGVFGTADDQAVGIASVAYDPTFRDATLALAASSAPLADGKYRVVVKGADPASGLEDLAGNALGGGADTTATFTVDHTPPTASVTEPAPGVRLLTLNRPGVRNAMTTEMTVAWDRALDQVTADRDTRVVVVTGGGSSFCSGADLSWLDQGSGEDVTIDRLRDRMLPFYRSWLRPRQLPERLLPSSKKRQLSA